MPKIGHHIEPERVPCDRCGSKRRVSKTWTERIKNDHGEMVLYHSKVICTNKKCQAEFEKKIAEDKEKRVKIRQIKLDNDSKRLADKQKAQALKKAAFSASSLKS